MTRRRCYLLAFCFVAVLGAAVVEYFWLSSPPQDERVTVKNIALIRPGMTEKEITDILGPPKTATKEVQLIMDTVNKEALKTLNPSAPPKYSKMWAGNGMMVVVAFAADDSAMSVETCRGTFAEETIWEKISAARLLSADLAGEAIVPFPVDSSTKHLPLRFSGWVLRT